MLKILNIVVYYYLEIKISMFTRSLSFYTLLLLVIVRNVFCATWIEHKMKPPPLNSANTIFDNNLRNADEIIRHKSDEFAHSLPIQINSKDEKSKKLLDIKNSKRMNSKYSLHEYILQMEKQWQIIKILSSQTYEYTFEWKCFCSTCLQIAKYIEITDDHIFNVEFSASTKKHLSLPKAGCDDLYLDISHYHTIDDLFTIIKLSSHPSTYDPNLHKIHIGFDNELRYK